MLIHATLKPNSKHREDVVVAEDGNLTIFTKSPAVEGRANESAVRLLAKYYAEPCPMCMSAIIWAKIPIVVYSITQDDMIAEAERHKRAGDSQFSWRQIAIPASYIVEHGEPSVELFPGFMREEGLKLF